MTHPSSPPVPMTAEQIDRLRVIVQGMTPGLDRDIFEKLLRCTDALTARVAHWQSVHQTAAEANERLRAELAAARKVEDGEVEKRLKSLAAMHHAALKAAERRETEAKTLQHQLASDLTVAVARAQAAEAKLESARRDALEEAASLAAEYGRAISKGLRRSAGPNDTGEQIAEAIRALQTKDTTE